MVLPLIQPLWLTKSRLEITHSSQPHFVWHSSIEPNQRVQCAQCAYRELMEIEFSHTFDSTLLHWRGDDCRAQRQPPATMTDPNELPSAHSVFLFEWPARIIESTRLAERLSHTHVRRTIWFNLSLSDIKQQKSWTKIEMYFNYLFYSWHIRGVSASLFTVHSLTRNPGHTLLSFVFSIRALHCILHVHTHTQHHSLFTHGMAHPFHCFYIVHVHHS